MPLNRPRLPSRMDLRTGRAVLPTSILVAFLLACGPTMGASYIVPGDDALIAQADTIVRGTVLDARFLRAPNGGIFTDIGVSVEKVLKGDAQVGVMTIRQIGGVLDDEVRIFPGTGEFGPGERVLLMLENRDGAPPRLLHYALGKFHVDLTTDGEEYAIRDGLEDAFSLAPQGGVYVERMRSLSGFESYIDGVAHGETPLADYYRDSWLAAPRAVASFVLLDFGGQQFARRLEFEQGQSVTYRDSSTGAVGAQCPTGCHAETQGGVIAWNGDPGSDISVHYGGTVGGISGKCITMSPALDNEIGYEDPCDEMSDLNNCAGTLALGGPSANPNVTSNVCQQGVNPLWKIVSGAIMVNNGVGACLNSCDFKDMIAHETGHTIGFGHTNVSTALMAPFIVSGRCGVLQPDDLAGAACLYPAAAGPLTCGATATPPSGEAPLMVSFDSNASGGAQPISVNWDFGDGTSGTQSAPSHLYSLDGTYTADLEVMDADGTICTDSVTVTATPCIGRILTSLKVKEKNGGAIVKLTVKGLFFASTDVVQVDNGDGNGFQDAPFTFRKKKTKLKATGVEAIFPDNSFVQVRVRKANGCAGSSLPASR